jgi:methionyl-tRNA formyltransferase
VSKVRVCFFGTPDFAVTALKALLADEHFEVVGVVTQPDRPSGRKLQLTASPVKTLALSNNLKVLAPESLKNNPLITDAIRSWGAEVGVVVAFGQILTESFLETFHFGCVNIHGSLLPRWRGAAPIQRSLEAGDTVTGVTLQKIVKRLDAGDIIGFRKLDVPQEMDAQELYEKLAALGSDLLRVELMDYVRGHLAPQPQDENLVTYAKKIEKSESMIDWQQSAQSIHNKVRAFVMGPGTYMMLNSKKVKIHKTSVSTERGGGKPPGELIANNKNQLLVQTGDGVLELLIVQPESRNRLSAEEFLKGYQS